MVGVRVRVEHRLGMRFPRPNWSRVPRCPSSSSLPAPSSQDLAVCRSRYDRKFVSLMTIRYREVHRQSQTADKLKLCRVLVSKHSRNANSKCVLARRSAHALRHRRKSNNRPLHCCRRVRCQQCESCRFDIFKLKEEIIIVVSTLYTVNSLVSASAALWVSRNVLLSTVVLFLMPRGRHFRILYS